VRAGPRSACAGRPADYGEALYWIVSRLFGGDPEGIGVSTLYGRLIGILVTVYGVLILVRIANDVFSQLIEENLQNGSRLVEEFNGRLPLTLSDRPPAIPAPPDGSASAVLAALGAGVLLGALLARRIPKGRQ